jgi:hypothetical protein
MLNPFPMLPIPQMDLEIDHRRLRARRVQLTRTIMTPYARQEHPFDAFGGLAGCWCGTGYFGCCVDGGVAHCAFEVVVRVRFLEFGEAVC